MIKKYFIPVVLLVGLGLVLVLLPPKKSYDEMPPEKLLRQITSSSRFITPDEIAERMIEKDPSLLLIDVRSSDDYLKFTLPGAINIPFEELLNPEQENILRQEGMDFIFFSNGSILSDQAWILSKRKGLKNIYIMQGGINQWFDNFFVNTPPGESAPASELELYQFRKGVRQFFTGGDVQATPQNPTETIQLEKRIKKSATEGGC